MFNKKESPSYIEKGFDAGGMESEWVSSVYKGKGDVQQCSNYRGIKLLNQTMKIWEKVLDARLRKVTGVASN